ncbi:MAG: hypothetical protein MUP71_04545 [Candidatus Aminicenantes bacterium]|nr:hypothetical protein [Candidatus Aminicenantes bacterium]
MSLRSIWAVALFLAAGADPLFNLMPSDGVPPGWQRSGKERLFIGAALYQHINGGAELYHQNGFDRLAVQDFAKADHELRVEIYKMNDPAGANAVFAEMTGGMAIQATYGSACVLDDYQILFQRGAYLVSLTTYENGAETLAALAALAAKIDAALSN